VSAKRGTDAALGRFLAPLRHADRDWRCLFIG